MFEELPERGPLTDEERDRMRLRKLADLVARLDRHGDDYQRIRATLAISGGPVIDPSDYASIETVIRLIRFLDAYPRSGGIA